MVVIFVVALGFVLLFFVVFSFPCRCEYQEMPLLESMYVQYLGATKALIYTLYSMKKATLLQL